jgi:hypothetical protein
VAPRHVWREGMGPFGETASTAAHVRNRLGSAAWVTVWAMRVWYSMGSIDQCRLGVGVKVGSTLQLT